MKRIPTPTMSEVLKNDFMRPIHMTNTYLAKLAHVSTETINKVMQNKLKINADLSIRLGLVYGLDTGYLLRIQAGIDLRNAEIKHHNEYSQIKPIKLSKTNRERLNRY